ncbi:fimbrial biogenesis chaperone [Stenotrophomonas beteli]|uniref:Pilus assembly protein n=1 Tax=Stenotrophomonas beteli TaxID=3384461 RepID=A0A0R0B2W9_9GAMM|nr:molecular chaperone [Stenotrophomonas maltophilia]KRG48898.1 pilus assembly protein [Stenotrophomonas maltophilia]
MRTALILLASLLAMPAAALDLSPTTLQLPVEGGRTELWLYNPGPGHWRGQVRVLAWEQQVDAERLRPTRQILASPVQLDLAAGARQRVWLLPGRPEAASVEQAYRIVLEPSQAGLPRYSLPLFRGQAAPQAQPRVQARIDSGASQPYLRLSNIGPLHARLHDLVFVADDGQRTLLLPGLAGYLLAGHERRWALPARPDGYHGGRFHARLQDGRQVDLTAPDPTIATSAPSGL